MLALIFTLAWPTMLEELMQTAVQYIDTAMVGTLGTQATAAVGATATVSWLVGSTVSAVGVGFLAIISQCYGAGDQQRAKRASAQAVTMTLLVGLLFTAVTTGLSGKITRWMQVDVSIRDQASQYCLMLYSPMLFRAASIIFATVLRSVGDTRTPMRVSLNMNLINIVLNYLLIYSSRQVHFFGLSIPMWGAGWGINGAAVASLIGMDTFENGQVTFRPGPVYLCARHGGFGILDEINMAKNEALAVLHATLDFRRAIDVPGYDRVEVSPAARFIGTMNYGYAGTRELNEALTSRFAVIQMPAIDESGLDRLLGEEFPTLEKKYRGQFVALFLDLQKKCESAEVSTKALDLRGMLDALKLIRRGISAGTALDMGITNKAFDSYEQGLVRDVIAARIPSKLDRSRLFTD